MTLTLYPYISLFFFLFQQFCCTSDRAQHSKQEMSLLKGYHLLEREIQPFSLRVPKLLHFLTLHCMDLCIIAYLLGVRIKDCSNYLMPSVLQVQNNKEAVSLLLGFLFTHRYGKYSLSGLMSLKTKMAKSWITYSNAPHHLICSNFKNVDFSVPMIPAKIPSVT